MYIIFYICVSYYKLKKGTENKIKVETVVQGLIQK